MFGFLIKNKKKEGRKSVADYKREFLIKQGGDQIRTLLKKGLSIPVGLL